jgi:hypothetical protein
MTDAIGTPMLSNGKRLRETGIAVAVLDALTRATADEHYAMVQHYNHEHYDLDWYGYGAILHSPWASWGDYWRPITEYVVFLVIAERSKEEGSDMPAQIMAHRLTQLGYTPCHIEEDLGTNAQSTDVTLPSTPPALH